MGTPGWSVLTRALCSDLENRFNRFFDRSGCVEVAAAQWLNRFNRFPRFFKYKK